MAVDGVEIAAADRVYIAMNKPRGIVVSASDEHGRDTVYALLQNAGLPWLAPVGRLDKASEGLLLLSNDPVWAARITDPASSLPKTYHVQVRGTSNAEALAHLREGVTDRDELLRAKSVALLRTGDKNAWLEIVLDEGRNRQIRRMLEALGYSVLRLVRVAIGPLQLGELPKGGWRELTREEIESLG
ncbi:MAG: rRNA pseudouridine synthase [Pseudomonadota bacterium]|nr:rRNA pseudouridine synthase [Pseudomonadota bacterium]